jgi:hypothetical protein
MLIRMHPLFGSSSVLPLLSHAHYFHILDAAGERSTFDVQRSTTNWENTLQSIYVIFANFKRIITPIILHYTIF